MGLFSSIVKGIKNLFGGDDDEKKKKQSSNQREITRNFQTRTYNSISSVANAAKRAGEQAATRSRLNGNNNNNQNKYQEFYNNQKKKYEEREEKKKSSNLKREENKYQNKYANKAQDNKKAEDIIKYTFATAQEKKNVTENQKKLKETQAKKEKQAEERRKLYQSDEWKKNQGKQIEENKKADELAKYTFMTNGEREAVKNHETHPVVNAVVRWANAQSSNLNRTGNVLLDRWDKGPISAKSQTLGLSIYDKDREEQMEENEERIKKADERIKKTTEEIEEFKEGQSTVGKFLTDVAVAGTELGLDLAAGKFTRTGMLPMFSRAAGQSAASAEDEGADRLSAWKYGIASGGIEALTEKMFVAVKPLNKVFGKGFTDELAQKAVNRLASKMTKEGSQKAVYHGGRMLAAAFGEGLEEMVSEGLDPSVANAIYADAIGQHKTLNPRDVLYSGLIGGTMGGLLGTGNVISENYSFNQNRESNQDNLDDIIKFAKDTDENSLAYKNAEAMRKVREAGEDVSNMQIEITKQELARDMEAQEKEYDNVINAANEVVRMNSFTSPVVEDNGYIVGLADNTERTYNDTFMAASEAAGKTFDNDLDIEDVSNAVASIRTGTGTVKDTDFFMPQNTENRKVYEEVTGEKLPSGNVATRQYLIEKMGQNFIQSAQAETEYRNDMVKGEILQNEMQNLDAAGQDIFVRGLESVVDGHDAEYASLFNHYYKGGRAGGLTFETVANMNPAYNNSFPESLKRDAFNAGQFDGGYLTNRTAENSSGKGSGGRVISTGRKVKASDYKFYQRVAQATGIDIEVTDNEGMRERLGQMSLDDNGTPNGFYDVANNRIIVNYEGDRAIDYIVSHELTHYMQDNAPEEYKALKEFLRKAWKEADIDGYNASIARKIQDYEKQGVRLTEEEALDEILADSTYEMIQNEDILRAICQENRTLAQKILDALKKILDMFRGMRTDFSPKYNKDLLNNLGVLEDTIAMWENGIKTASENRNIKSFEITKSDIEKNINTVIDMKPVSVLNDTEFSTIFENKGIKELKKRVSAYYEEIGGYAHSQDIGDVSLRKRSVTDDVGHGIGKTKADAFKTVPDVIEKGKIIQAKRNWKGRKYDSVVIAAPVEINGSEYLEGVVIKRDVKSKNQGLYVHEVLLQKNSSKKVQLGGLASKTSPSQFATVNSLLQNIIDVKNGDLSREKLYKIIDTDEGKFSLKFSFAGESALNSDNKMLEKAKGMISDGVDAEVVRRETGWHIGKDGKWRFEIDDSQMEIFPDGDALFSSDHVDYKRWNDLFTKMLYGKITQEEFDELQTLDSVWSSEKKRLRDRVENSNATLENIIKHDVLFENYPQLRNIHIRLDDMEKNVNGAYSPSRNEIRLNRNISKPINADTLLHEIQHAIQVVEGFSTGKQMSDGETFDVYWDSDGEVEARTSTERRTLNSKERISTKFSMRELDERYMAAVENGDMKTAQAMVNAYARERGYEAEEDYRGWHEAPRAPIARENFQNLEELQKLADDGDDLSLYAIANGISIVPEDFFTYEGARLYGNNDETGSSSLNVIMRAINSVQKRREAGNNSIPKISVYRAVPKDIRDERLRSGGQWVTPSRAYAVEHGKSQFGAGNYNIVRESVPVTELWWDGNDIREWGFDDGRNYAYRNTKNNRKLLDPVTYDEDGNVIPLSKRFNYRDYSPKFSLKETEEAEDKLTTDIKEFHRKLRAGEYDTDEELETVRAKLFSAANDILDSEEIIERDIDSMSTSELENYIEDLSGVLMDIHDTYNDRLNFNFTDGDAIQHGFFYNSNIAEESGHPINAEMTARDMIVFEKLRRVTEERNRAIDMLVEKNHLAEEVENNIEDIYNSDDTTQFHNMPSYGKKALRAKAVRQKSYEELQNEIQRLREEFKVTDGKMPDKEDIRRKVRMLVSETLGQNLKKGKKTNLALTEVITDQIYEAAKDAKSGQYESIGDICMEAARELAYEIDFTPNHVLFDYYMGLNEYLRQTPIRLTERDKANITDYNYLRRRMFGKVKLVNADHYTDGNIENVYMEMHELFPELISGEAEVTDDMLNEIIEVRENFNNLDDVITDEEFEQVVKDLAGDLLDITFGAKTRVTRADRWQQKYDKLKSDMQKALADANAKFRQQKKEIRNEERTWYREKRAEAVKKEREKAEKKLEKYKEKQKQKDATRKETAQRKESRASIEKNLSWLSDRVLKPTDDKHLPEGFRQPMAEFLKAFDLQTNRSKQRQEKTGHIAQKTLKLAALRRAYESVAKEDGTGEFEYDGYIMDLMKAAEAKLDGKSLDEATTADMRDIDTILKAIRHNISHINKMFNENIKQTVSEKGDEIINEMSQHHRKNMPAVLKGIDRLLNESMVTPGDFFELLGSGMNSVYMPMRKGFDTHIEHMRTIREFFYKLTEGNENKNFRGRIKPGSELEKLRDTSQMQTFELEGGGQISLNPAQIMSLYCLNKREQAQGHIYGSGIVASEIETGKRLKKYFREEKVIQSSAVQVTPTDVAKITSTLTEEQRDMADKMMRFLNTTCAEWGNEASMKLYGYKKFTERNYFPIQSADAYLDSNFDRREVNERIKNFGFTKGTVVNANNPIMIADIFEVVSDHINKMSLYGSLAVPIADFQRVYNYKPRNEDGTMADSVKARIREAFGEKPITYIKNFMADINNNTTLREEGMTRAVTKLLANYKKAAIGMNLRVLVQQPTAVVRAFTYISPKYFVGIKSPRKAMKEMQKYCPIAFWKRLGHSQTDVARDIDDIMMNREWSTFDLVSMRPYGYADDVTWGIIWTAVKREVKATHPDVKEGSEEFWKLCSDRASEIYDKTQVVDSPFHRSQVMRNKETMVKTMTSFMAEPTRTFNMVRTELVNARRMWVNGDKKAATAKANRALSVYLVNAAFVSAMAAVVDAMRGKEPDDEDKDKKGFELWLANFENNFSDNASPLNNIVLAKDIWQLRDGWGTSNMALEGFEALWKNINGWQKYAAGESDKSALELTRGSFESAGMIFGIPGKNMMRELETILGDKVLAAEPGKEQTNAEKAAAEYEYSDSMFDKIASFFGGGKSEVEKQEKAFNDRAEEVQNEIEGLSGEEKEDKLWSVTTKNYTKVIEEGDYATIKNMRSILERLGSAETVEKFDEKVESYTLSNFKKTVGTAKDDTVWRDYMIQNLGYDENKISEVVCKTDTAKSMQQNFATGNDDAGVVDMAMLIMSGATKEDLYELYVTRSKSIKATDYATGDYSAPLEGGTVSSSFGWRNIGRGDEFHAGVDIAAAAGTDVKSMDGGKVTYAGWNNARGYYIRVSHGNNRTTLYQHLNDYTVLKGDVVKPGQIIGHVGSTGDSTGPHLHLEMKVGGEYVDPTMFW
ncbi:peptidoglycan DD-metalloendopeptidase family protein [Gallibacter intestinalis]|uniref:Peptidoglycan DD-metalloendopeptidase family protein n=1 Tax=Gallibacter intestinalis TaxID=2779356 RepID=A0ABR9QXX8_9FIRM|nr:peptidoglycan DD-metalloendopeptidase family protein [Gallibacter intestinalis]MBE5035713.1 peptidoglycan DD-metalloendopeptidase family protein [Gallibacter intestinalis]